MRPSLHSSSENRNDRSIRAIGIALAIPLSLITAVSGCGGSSGPASPSPAQITSAQIPCANLASMSIPGGTVQHAETIAAGSYTPPSQATPVNALPAFCRVSVLMQPSSDSSINVEVWLPQAGWNGRFLATGNGGGAGSISYATGIVEGLKRGFATANTDMGTAPDINTTVGHPERWTDFGYRANHEMTVAAKALVQAYYTTAPTTSYFEGCSTGGQQAMTIAQRYPKDYNGILAGAAANNRTHLNAMFLWNLKALNAPGAKLTQGKLDLITKSVISACAGKDGGAPTDSFLTDPRQCHFNPDTLPKCTGADSNSCLTTAQLAALKATYSGPVNPRTGERLFTGMPFGTENVPLGLAQQEDTATWPSQQFYQFFWTFGANYDYTKFDFDHDMDTVDNLLASTLNANSADLSEFKSNGGKLMMYTGSSDPGVPFPEAIKHYERVVSQQGGDLAATQDFYRYYLVPGMGHCASIGGGPGLGDFGQPYSNVVPPDKTHDMLLQMVDWVENHQAPQQITAAKYAPGSSTQTVMERPLCTYPELPVFSGGDSTKASSFVCKAAPRGDVATPAPRYLN